MRNSILIAVLAVGAGCEAEDRGTATTAASKDVEVEVAPAKKGSVQRADFDIEGTATLVRENRVKDGKQLETQINKNPKNRVDVDGDGKRDRLQVVEVREEKQRALEVRAIPSSKPKARPEEVGVPVATVEFVPDGETAHVTVEYAPVVVVDESVVITFDAPIVVDTFCHWVLVVERPIFVGVAYVDAVIHEHHKHKKFKHKKHKKH